MKDVQNEQDRRNIQLKQVGIKKLRWPIELKDKEHGSQHSVADVSLSVDLPHNLRGTHMSRFVECLQELGPISLNALEKVVEHLKVKLEAEKAFLQLSFPYFIYKTAPVSKQQSPMDLDCICTAEKGEDFSLKICVKIPIQTLCPCSKEISSYGAHNQRAIAEIEVLTDEMIWIEELAEIADKAASAPIYGLLKRPDEKFVTEQAYDNPRFVEDAVREIALLLEADKRIKWYRTTVESIESIHNHNAFACVEKGW